MVNSRFCRFYRDSGTLSMGQGLGYCDFDCTQTTCDGDVDFCEKPDALKRYLFQLLKKEGELKWETKKDALFSGSQKV